MGKKGIGIPLKKGGSQSEWVVFCKEGGCRVFECFEKLLPDENSRRIAYDTILARFLGLVFKGGLVVRKMTLAQGVHHKLVFRDLVFRALVFEVNGFSRFVFLRLMVFRALFF